VKLDTEGAEINILRGGQLLKSEATIFCELHRTPGKNSARRSLNCSTLLEYGRTINYPDESLKIQDGPSWRAIIQ
jgi:hypothetical protein